MYRGYIKHVVADRGFGFVAAEHQPDVFFHVSDLHPSLNWDELLIGRRVRFDITSTAKGDRATRIEAAE